MERKFSQRAGGSGQVRWLQIHSDLMQEALRLFCVLSGKTEEKVIHKL